MNYETDQAVEFLQNWDNRGPWLLSAIDLESAIETKPFFPDQEKAARAWIDEHQGSRNIYFHVNRPRRPIGKKAKKQDIAEAHSMHVDIDPRAGLDRNEERARILAMLQAYEPAPSVIIDSGNGYGGFWRIPPDDDLHGIELRNKYIARKLGGDPAGSIDHLMRLPGTLNVPTRAKLAKGYPAEPSLARVVSAAWTRWHSVVNFPKAPDLSFSRPEAAPVGPQLKLSAEELVILEKYEGAGISLDPRDLDFRRRDGAIRQIAEAVARVKAAPNGSRNPVLAAEAFFCGTLVVLAGLEEERVMNDLIAAVPGERNPRKDAAAVRYQFRQGQLRPSGNADERITETYRTAHRLLQMSVSRDVYVGSLQHQNAKRSEPLDPDIVEQIAARVVARTAGGATNG